MGMAVQTDIEGPPGSVYFGTAVSVLPNGNIVVTDPLANVGAAATAGAVYLLSPSGNVISRLSGSSPGDRVGSDGVVLLPSGNFVVVSTQWNNAGVPSVGAVTWIDGESGLDAHVSAANSLVGTAAYDRVGYAGVAVLVNGNYVVRSSEWNNGDLAYAGAVTWGSGAMGISGPVSAANSVVGTTVAERLGSFNSITALTDGRYVLVDPNWSDGVNVSAGAVILLDGDIGLSGTISAADSLIGASANDAIGAGGVVALPDGNYVVASPYWSHGSTQAVGAVTFVHAKNASVGIVSAGNSLIGSSYGDRVGVGGSEPDSPGAVALANGNYVVVSSRWNNGAASEAGAVTWCSGSSGCVGHVSSANSLVGTASGDRVGASGVTALTNGNYVAASYRWGGFVGHATWGNGTSGIVGPVTSSNSLVGTTTDQVAEGGVRALTNGNYVVLSPFWTHGAEFYAAGAATWGDGSVGISGFISDTNSLIGTRQDDYVGTYVTALPNGSYIVDSVGWSSEQVARIGAVTWSGGTRGIVGTPTSANSLVGGIVGDEMGRDGTIAFTDGNYAILSTFWRDYPDCSGAVTLASQTSRLVGTLRDYNSVTCGFLDMIPKASIGYDPGRKRLAVGRPGINRVTLLTMEQIFGDMFER